MTDESDYNDKNDDNDATITLRVRVEEGMFPVVKLVDCHGIDRLKAGAMKFQFVAKLCCQHIPIFQFAVVSLMASKGSVLEFKDFRSVEGISGTQNIAHPFVSLVGDPFDLTTDRI